MLRLYGGLHIRYFTLISSYFRLILPLNFCLISGLIFSRFRPILFILGHKSLSVGPQPGGHSAGRVTEPCTDAESYRAGTDRDAQGMVRVYV